MLKYILSPCSEFLNTISIQITVWQDMMVGQHLILHIAASEDGQVSYLQSH